MRPNRPLATWLVALPILATMPMMASAHHSLAAYYDDAATVTLSGVVSAVQFTNPHVHIWVTVTDKGADTVWDMEFTGTSFFVRKGLTRDFVHVGDRISATGYPGRRGLAKLRPTELVLADGTRMSMRVVNPLQDADAGDK